MAPVQILSAQSEAPAPLDQWLTAGISVRIASKWSAAFMRQYSRPHQSGSPFDYYLDDFGLSRNLGKHWDVFGSFSYLVVEPQSDEPVIKRRYTLGIGWQSTLVGNLRSTFRFSAERHLQERRYDGRLIGMARLDYTGLNLFNTVHIRPYCSTQLYYFLGGDWIKQYDNTTGDLIRRSPTYGLHRMRARLGIAVTPVAWMQLSAFYLIQNEFNYRHAIRHHHQINEINPDNGKITRPFDNFKVWGMGLTFFINARKKAKHKPEDNTSFTE